MPSSPTRSTQRSTESIGRISEEDWHSLMRDVVAECRRILETQGQCGLHLPTQLLKRSGRCGSGSWEFVAWAGEGMESCSRCLLVGDRCDAPGGNRPKVRTDAAERQDVRVARTARLLSESGRRSVDTIAGAWLQNIGTDMALRIGPSGRNLPEQHHYRKQPTSEAAPRRSICCRFPTGSQPGGAEHHPAATPYDVAAWWCRYILPPGGVLLDPFCGSGTMLVAGSGPRSIEGHRHRQREEISGDCEAADHKGLKYHRIPSRSATLTILASTNAASKLIHQFLRQFNPRSQLMFLGCRFALLIG